MSAITAPVQVKILVIGNGGSFANADHIAMQSDWSEHTLEAESILKRARDAAGDRKRADACRLAVALAKCALAMLKAFKQIPES